MIGKKESGASSAGRSKVLTGGGNSHSRESRAVDYGSSYRKFRKTQRYCKSRKAKKLQEWKFRLPLKIMTELTKALESVEGFIRSIVSKLQLSMLSMGNYRCIRSIFSVLLSKLLNFLGWIPRSISSAQEDFEGEIKKNMGFLYTMLPLLPSMFKVISFDNLALEQLKVQRILSEKEWSEFYMGDDGQYTFYIDAVRGTFSKDSVTAEVERFDISQKSVDEMFNEIRTKYAKIPV